jgi:Glycosyl transferase family 2
MPSPQFTIIVPTRERLSTLKHCLRTLTTQTYGDLEIIVSDNASTDGTQTYVESLQDSRIRYFNTGQRISMSQNWEFALQQARGVWVGFLGDDDGLLPNCFESLSQLIDRTQAQAIRTRACSYIWPGAIKASQALNMSVPLGTSHHVRTSSLWLEKTLAGAVNYSELPMIYNGGFVKRELLEHFSKRHGKLFFSRIPDVFSGILIAHLVDSYIYSTEPVAINGTSSFSTGYAQFKGASNTLGAHNSSNPSVAFAKESNLPFHKNIPLLRDGDIPKSLQALILESQQQVADLLPGAKKIDPLDAAQLVLNTRHNMSAQQQQQWIDDFRSIHQISVQVEISGHPWPRLLNTLRFLIYRSALAWNSYSVDIEKNNLMNVYDASITANQIRQQKPFYLFNLLTQITKVLLRQKNSNPS